MRKLALILLLTVIGLQVKAAEQFDELNLRGRWELISYNGAYDLFTFPYFYEYSQSSIADCKYLTFEDLVLAYEYDLDNDSDTGVVLGLSEFSPNSKYNEWACFSGIFTKQEPNQIMNDGDMILVTDYYITNNNKLHIDLASAALRFVIESFTENELHLKSFDGKFTANYRRVSNPTTIKEVHVQSNLKEIYNINGLRKHSLSKGVNIVRNGKEVRKVIN